MLKCQTKTNCLKLKILKRNSAVVAGIRGGNIAFEEGFINAVVARFNRRHEWDASDYFNVEGGLLNQMEIYLELGQV